LVLTRDFEKINGSTVFNGKRKTVAANFTDFRGWSKKNPRSSAAKALVSKWLSRQKRESQINKIPKTGVSFFKGHT
jgi:hypothetical protein